MTKSKPIEIQLSKFKLSLMIIGSLIFVTAGVWLIWHVAVTPASHFRRFYFGLIVGSVSILFFGLAAVYLFKKLLDNKPGLIICDDGIIDNSGALSIGFIPWTDVVEIHEVFMGRQIFIIVEIINPLEYIDRQENTLKRRWMKANYKLYRSVIGITANGLKCNHNELLNLLDSTFRKFKERKLIK